MLYSFNDSVPIDSVFNETLSPGTLSCKTYSTFILLFLWKEKSKKKVNKFQKKSRKKEKCYMLPTTACLTTAFSMKTLSPGTLSCKTDSTFILLFLYRKKTQKKNLYKFQKK